MSCVSSSADRRCGDAGARARRHGAFAARHPALSRLWACVLAAALTLPLGAAQGQAAAPLAVQVSRFSVVGPGQIRFDVTIAGFQPDLQPAVEGTATVGERTVAVPPGRIGFSRAPVVLDLRAGRVWVGGVPSAEFSPIPPLDENAPIAVTVTVRQGDAVATARQSDVLLLPSVIVPGYLSDLGGKGFYPGVLSVLERRGYRATGPWPTLFWFGYASRRLSIEEAARGLASYVHDVVLPSTYASRVNIVGYSLGGLLVRWNMAFEPGWDRLVNRFVMIAVPNEGTVATYVDGWYPIVTIARTPAARSLTPTFPFWRPTPTAPWSMPRDAANPILARLNVHALPDGIRAYAFYGSARPASSGGRGTWQGITGELPQVEFAYGPGDGFVLAASALGLPINGGPGVPGVADRLVQKVDLGAVRHRGLLVAVISKVADALTDRAPRERAGSPKDRETSGGTTGPAGAARIGPSDPGAGFSIAHWGR